MDTTTTLILLCWCSVFTQVSFCLSVPPQPGEGNSKAPPPPSHVVDRRHSIASFNRLCESGFCFPRFSPQSLNKLILPFYSPSPEQCSHTFHYFTALWWIKHLPARFPPQVSSFGLNISRCVFSGGFSGCAEKEEGSLPPAAVWGLAALSKPLPPNFIYFLWLSQLMLAFICFG